MNPDFLNITVTDAQLLQMSSLALAHVGDAVFELMTRCDLALSGHTTNFSLHKDATRRACASTQAHFARQIRTALTDEEEAVFKRARNAKSHSPSKASTRADYCLSTALEALFGWLYLKGRHERVSELYALCLQEEVGLREDEADAADA